MKDIFEIKNRQYNLRRYVNMQRRNVNTILYGTETIPFLGAQIWNLTTKNVQCLKSFNKFRKIIENGL